MTLLLRKLTRPVLIYGLLFTILSGCSANETDTVTEQPVIKEQQSDEVMVSKTKVTATVKYIDLEGGFYGLVTEDGQKLLPTNLSKEYLEEGMVIQFQTKTIDELATIQQWGTMVELKNVTLVQSSEKNIL